MPAFAFVEKPFDLDRLFATVERAVESRRMNRQSRRLVWELQTINEIADGISRSLELDEVLTGAMQRLVPALDAAGGSIRLRDEITGQYELRALVGPRTLYSVWSDLDIGVIAAERSSDRDAQAGTHNRHRQRSSRPTRRRCCRSGAA